MPCVFEGCGYKTNKYTTFHSHKSRKHNTRKQYKSDFVEDENDCGLVLEEDEDLNKIITKRVGLLILRTFLM